MDAVRPAGAATVMASGSRLVFDHLMEPARSANSRLALAALLGAVPDFDLACIGTSIRGLGAMTLETVSYLTCADVVYCYPPTAAHLDLLTLLNENVVNVHDTFYVRGSEFDQAYSAIIGDVLNTLRQGKKVAYATQGSPAFHCGTAVSLHRAARREGFRSILLSGISSFELLSASLLETHDLRNVQILHTVDVIGGHVTIDPRYPCFLCDLGRYALPAVRESAQRFMPERLCELGSLLSTLYDQSQEIILLYLKTNGECAQLCTSIAGLSEALMKFVAPPTLFMPGRAKQ